MGPSTIGSINLLPDEKKREIYSRMIPPSLLEHFNLPPVTSQRTQSLMTFKWAPGATDVSLSFYHEQRFPDPILYGHLTDTISGQIHVLLYILNDPDAPRFNVDVMPDGSPTHFGIFKRNLSAEQAALHAGLTPGQVRLGLKMLGKAIESFEAFITSLGHEMYFVEPLYYHNAVIFERYGMAYQKGRRLMERIETGFSENGDLLNRLDGSSPFRQPGAAKHIRLRSWAIHDGILGEPFTDVTMYKRIGKNAGVNTCHDCPW